MAEMNPADVPDELVRAALLAWCIQCSLTVGRQPMSDHEEDARWVLAGALPLYEQQLRAERDIATARAEQAEAALAELRTLRTEWSTANALIEPDDGIVSYERALDRTTDHPLIHTALLSRQIYASPWREVDATPRTALKRAADEQGGGNG